jgi:hypothetical protein
MALPFYYPAFAICYIFAIPKAGSEVVISKSKIPLSSDVSIHLVFVKSSIGLNTNKNPGRSAGFWVHIGSKLS